jgi:heat shock protein HslJ
MPAARRSSSSDPEPEPANDRLGAVRVLLTLVPVLFSVVACAAEPGATPFRFDGVLWRAMSVAGVAPPPDHAPTLTFSNSSVSGSSGCNEYGGQARIIDGRFVTDQIASTLRLCLDDAANRIESSFMSILGSRPLIGPRGDQLVLAGQAGEIVFERAAEPPPTN